MKKLRFKFLTLLSAICLISILCVPTFAATESENFSRLLSYGYEEEFLKKISDSALEKIIDLIGNSEVDCVEQKKDLPYVQKDSASGLVLNMVSARLKDPSNGNITGEAVSCYWEWASKKPLIRDADYISVTWNEEILNYVSDSFYAEDYSKKNPADDWTIDEKLTVLSTALQGELGWHTHPAKTAKNFGGFAAFSLSTKVPKPMSTEYDNVLRVSYTHETTRVVLPVVLAAPVLIAAVLIILAVRRKKKARAAVKNVNA